MFLKTVVGFQFSVLSFHFSAASFWASVSAFSCRLYFRASDNALPVSACGFSIPTRNGVILAGALAPFASAKSKNLYCPCYLPPPVLLTKGFSRRGRIFGSAQAMAISLSCTAAHSFSNEI